MSELDDLESSPSFHQQDEMEEVLLGMDEELQSLRASIDKIDEQLLKLLNERAKLSIAVGNVKKGSSVHRPERENAVLQALYEKTEILPKEHVESIWNEIFNSSCALQGLTR